MDEESGNGSSGELPVASRVVAMVLCALALGFCLVAIFQGVARAQETREEESDRRSAALGFLPRDAARRVFGAATTAAPGEPESIGQYWLGCYSGGLRLPAVGEHWQVMRPSRNRNWGQPLLVDFLERFAARAAAVTGWPGILVGDMSQPRGGPMLTGHASHQMGIEADIWLRPRPKTPFDAEQVEEVRSTDLVRADGRDVDPKVYTRQHLALLRAAAEQPEVARVFVNAAIKKALCRDAGEDREWLRKIRPAAGHSYHFHIRLNCPDGQEGCEDQSPPGPGDGCSAKELNYWFSPGVLHAKLGGPGRTTPLAAMPKACRALAVAPPVLAGGASGAAPTPAAALSRSSQPSELEAGAPGERRSGAHAKSD